MYKGLKWVMGYDGSDFGVYFAGGGDFDCRVWGGLQG